jgi:multidrug efflux pump subunit AcrA (membrane-fusion protein)
VIGGKKWTVSASVDDTQVDLVARNDQVQITTDASSTPVFGTVRSVSVMASSSSTSASYPVDISVTGSPSGLHDGEAATVSIIYKQHTNVLTVSTAAIHSDGSAKYVYVDDNGSQAKRTVRTGLSSDGTTEIKSGLKSGDQVYVETVTLPTSRSSGSTDGSRFGNGSVGYPGGFTGGGQYPGGGAPPAFNGTGGN